MSKVFKILATAIVLTVILVMVIAGAALADNPEKGKMNQNQTGDCVCDNDCTPIEHYYNHNWSGPGQHGERYGQVTE